MLPLLIIIGEIFLFGRQIKTNSLFVFLPIILLCIPILIMFSFTFLIWNESEKIIIGDYALSNVFCYLLFGLISIVYLLRSKYGPIHPEQ